MYADTSNWAPDERQHQNKPEMRALILNTMTTSPTT